MSFDLLRYIFNLGLDNGVTSDNDTVSHSNYNSLEISKQQLAVYVSPSLPRIGFWSFILVETQHHGQRVGGKI